MLAHYAHIDDDTSRNSLDRRQTDGASDQSIETSDSSEGVSDYGDDGLAVVDDSDIVQSAVGVQLWLVI